VLDIPDPGSNKARSNGDEIALMFTQKNLKRKCARCKAPAKWMAGLKAVCSVECAGVLALLELEKKAKKERLEYNRETRRRKAALRDVDPKWWKKKATVELHYWVREVRDAGLPCISCGRSEWEIDSALVGGKWDAGHYLTKGAHEELRFEPLNIHKQCKSCNSGSYHHAIKGRTVAEGYRERLIVKIGLEGVEWLEGPHKAKRYRIDDYKRIFSEYKAMNDDYKRLQKCL